MEVVIIQLEDGRLLTITDTTRFQFDLVEINLVPKYGTTVKSGEALEWYCEDVLLYTFDGREHAYNAMNALNKYASIDGVQVVNIMNLIEGCDPNGEKT